MTTSRRRRRCRACHLPLVEGAPGHGEGHNAGQAVNITAALAVKRVMERDYIAGTIKIWPGVAEELGGGKAFLVRAGYSDDIGDVSWNVPTVVLLYPSNIPNLPGHNWSNGITMATPIAHKGATTGAKVQAMTMLDFLLRPELVEQAWGYFRNVQTKTIQYKPFIRPEDQPALELNGATMEKYRPAMRRYYYDPMKYRTYLEQLGVTYPTLRQPDGRCVGGPAK